jgi:phenylacetate-CoA ligase
MRLTPIEAWTARKIGHAGEAITRADIDAYQLEKLRATLSLVFEKSQFYRRQLTGAALDLAGLADVARLPFTTAEDIRNNPLQFL